MFFPLVIGLYISLLNFWEKTGGMKFVDWKIRRFLRGATRLNEIDKRVQIQTTITIFDVVAEVHCHHRGFFFNRLYLKAYVTFVPWRNLYNPKQGLLFENGINMI